MTRDPYNRNSNERTNQEVKKATMFIIFESNVQFFATLNFSETYKRIENEERLYINRTTGQNICLHIPYRGNKTKMKFSPVS